MRAMRQGDFETAWCISDEVLRHRMPASPASGPLHLRSVWDGTPLDGRRVLVRCYHGLGDAIQFLRLVKPLADRAAGVAVEAPEALLPLLSGLSGADRLIRLGDDPGAFDVDIEVQELPHALRLQPEDLGFDVPYLAVGSTAHDAARTRLMGHSGLAVGLVWTAGAWLPTRSVPLRLLAPLAGIPDIQLYSLQQGPARSDVSIVPGLRDVASDDLCNVAAILATLDLVISVDTLVAHLAAALGRPTWILLQEPADWRWMAGRRDSPWYPTVRLYRQEEPGDWRRPLRELANDLENRAAGRPGI